MNRAHRLSSARDFRRVMAEGRRARGSAVLCAVARTEDDHPPRIGVRAPRTVGTAVARNTASRRVRAVLRDCLPAMPSGTDVIVTALPRAAVIDFQELELDVRGALRKAGLPC